MASSFLSFVHFGDFTDAFLFALLGFMLLRFSQKIGPERYGTVFLCNSLPLLLLLLGTRNKRRNLK